MAGSAKDFFTNAMQRALDLKNKGMDKAAEAFNGLRGSAQPAADPFAEYGPRQPSAEKLPTAQERMGSRGTPQRPAWGGGASPEAQAFRPAATAPTSPIREASIAQKSGLLRRAVGGAGRLVGGAAAGLAKHSIAGAAAYGGVNAAIDAAKNGNTDEDYAMAERMFALGLPEFIRNSGPAKDFEHATSPIRAAVAGLPRRFLGAFGIGASEAAPAAAAAAPAGGGPGGGAPIVPQAGGGPDRPFNPDLIDTIRGSRITPAALMAGNDIPASGQGAIQVSGRPARKVGYTQEVPAAAPEMLSAREYDLRRGFSPTGGARPASTGDRMADLAGGLAGSRVMYNNAENNARRQAVRDRDALRASVDVRGQNLAADTARRAQNIALYGHELDFEGKRLSANKGVAEDARKNTRQRVTDYVTGKNPLSVGMFSSSSTASAEHKARNEQQTATVMNRIASTASRMGQGKDIDSLDSTTTTKLLMGNTMRDRIESYRQTLGSKFRDYFGSNRFDSDDLRSYMPAMDKDGKVLPATRSKLGGYLIKLGNGNEITVTDAQGGGFNILGLNDPIDADMAALIRPAIDALRNKAR